MKLTDYIFGSRRGREANRLEREAMADPFLADAVEGYDSVYGGHSDKLAELEQEVARRAVRPRRRAGRRRIVPLIRGAVAVAAVVAVAVVWYLRRPSSEVPSEEIAQAVRSFGLPAENLTEPAGDFVVPAEGFAEPSEGFWVEPADGQAEPAADFAAADEEAAPAVAETMRQAAQPVASRAAVETDRVEVSVQEEVGAANRAAVLRPNGADRSAATANLPAGMDAGSGEAAERGARSASVLRNGTEPAAWDGDGEAATAAFSETRRDTVSNPAFAEYFYKYRRRVTLADGTPARGRVVAEFRVNDAGVPSGIRIVAGLSPEINREVIELLLEGPRWEPTSGERIRTVLLYE